ncbi:hypothetical protein BRADI_1g29360v3 [Brachypodium distachyon]|uniref:Uncharacterized protein n=1 Tax=Brachypodium distachyon TaxID=15368 RepID=A0A0Q3KZM0_BRADI|nr:hypothetical protein BRADI_1g29360v3 [Brachypodium distachyon]
MTNVYSYWHRNKLIAQPVDQFTKYSWVDVPHPFNLTDLACRLLVDFHSDNVRAKETAALGIVEGQSPIQGCCKFLREDTCLVVIDGLQSTQDWDLIKAAFLSMPIKGCILVITNEARVAKHCVDGVKDQVVNIKGLAAEAALRILTKMAPGGEHLTPKNAELRDLTMLKCGGLPKVIADIGQYLHESRWDTWMLEDINANFMAILEKDPRFHSLKGLFCWMQSYFDACPDSLKPCIFYLSVFPFDQDIRRRRLLRRWIAEGYSRDKSTGSIAEDDGEMLFSELVNLSIIQQQSLSSSCNKVVMWQVNGFFREYIMSRPMEDNLVFALEGRCSLNSQQHAGQHLTIRSSWDRDETVFKSIDLSRLRSLTVFGEWRSFFISSSSSSRSNNMRLLRVLDLEDTTNLTDDDMAKIGKLLPRLKFLSLRGCRKISHVPSSFGGLKQLQTLDVRHTSIVTLPLAIIKLHKLQYVRAGSTDAWDRFNGTVKIISAAEAAQADGGNGIAPIMPAAAAEEEEEVKDPSVPTWSRRAGALVRSRFRRQRPPSSAPRNVGGVEFPAGIWKLTALHTLGVINVDGSAFLLKELKKLTQLRKLGVSGINRGNIHQFSSAISGHTHLESLSVLLNEDCLDDTISEPPPSTLKSLKLNGHVHRLPPWIKQLDKLQKLDLGMTLSREDINVLAKLTWLEVLCLKPIQDGELRFCRRSEHELSYIEITVLEIDCCSSLQVNFRDDICRENITIFLKVIKVHCFAGSSLSISGLAGVENLLEVWLTGPMGTTSSKTYCANFPSIEESLY